MQLIDNTLANTEWASVWENRVSLVANSGIQFLDFEFIFDPNENFKRNFVEELNEQGKKELKFGAARDAPEEGSEVFYSVKAERALQPFWGKWLPAPLFAKVDHDQAGLGPLDWCRLRIVDVSSSYQLEEGKKPVQLQIAIDTSTSNSQDSGYLQPSFADADRAKEFSFKNTFDDLTQFLRDGLDSDDEDWDDAWVSALLRDIFESYIDARDAKNKLVNRPIEALAKMEGWARYITFMQYISSRIDIPKIILLKSPEDNDRDNIEVDLVLDIGNSRTAGLLIEQRQDGEDSNVFSRVSLLTLRNLSNPQYVYEGLFESRVEFVNLEFGNSNLSRLSGRNNAFAWPSFVRFGPEAVKLVQQDTGVEAIYGTSSPKRYLWDNSDTAKWPFRNVTSEEQPSSVAPHLPNLTPQGDYIPQIKDDMKKRLRHRTEIQQATGPTFSKSSLFGFMVAEILTQAFVQINSAAYRSNKSHLHKPRKLRRIILTLPTSTPSQEQAIIRSRVNGAVSMIWDRMVQVGQVSAELKPTVILDWDEASCSNVVYLYNEIVQKFEGDNDLFFSTFGKSRLNSENNEVASIRMGCVDVGGGTTDVMVTTFYQKSDVMLIPEENFREGFRTAGDDVRKEIIEKIILPKIVETFEPDIKEKISAVLSRLFGPNKANQTALERQKKRQFGLRILGPLAEKILRSTSDKKQIKLIKFNEIENSSNKIEQDLVHYLDREISKIVGSEWSLMDQKIEVKYQDISDIFRHLFYEVFLDISNTMRQLGVDKVLLTGRTSMHPAVLNLLTEVCPCPARDIIALHGYKATWYPFADPKGRINDPKSTVVVGAMLIALSHSRFQRFVIPDKSFSMKSTANYIGIMQQNGHILDKDVIFKDINEVSYQEPGEIKMAAKIFIGSRQFEAERWVTSPLYKIDFAGNPNHPRPYTVRIQKREPFDTSNSYDGNHDTRLVSEALKEQIEIEEVEDAEGNMIPKKEVTLQLRTLRTDEYWLDTGEFATDEL